ncbi:MAG: hypothetical protein ABSD77_06960 [Verrucomicrobiota bacterium]
MGLAIIWFGIYTLAVFGLAILFYRLLLNKMWLVPMLAEIVLIKSMSTTSPLWKGLVVRFAGITIGNMLAYFLYIVPVIYHGKEPWSEEVLWIYIAVAVQTSVAVIAQLVSRCLLQKKQASSLK